MDEEELSIEDLEPRQYIEEDSLNIDASDGSNHFSWMCYTYLYSEFFESFLQIGNFVK